MTFNNIKDLFKSISVAHEQLKGFGFGNEFEINGADNEYPLLWIIPLESITNQQTRVRKFFMLVVSVGKHDQSDRDEIWSDTEQVFDDVIKILRNESDDYELLNDVIKFPVSEKYSDWVTGWQAELEIETDLNSNYCDIPKGEL
jgi:hypothetical protein